MPEFKDCVRDYLDDEREPLVQRQGVEEPVHERQATAK